MSLSRLLPRCVAALALVVLGGQAVSAAGPAAVLPVAGRTIPFVPCADAAEQQHLSVESMLVSSWPPSRSGNTTLSVDAMTDVPILGGQYTVSVEYMGAPFLTQTGDVSELFDLPAPAGPITIDAILDLSAGAPNGLYSLEVELTNVDASTVGCFATKFPVSDRFPERPVPTEPEASPDVASIKGFLGARRPPRSADEAAVLETKTGPIYIPLVPSKQGPAPADVSVKA